MLCIPRLAIKMDLLF